MAIVTDVPIAATTTPILTADNPDHTVLWNPGPVVVDLHFQGPAGVADDHRLAIGQGIEADAYQRVDGIDATATGVIQILRGVRPL